MTLTLILGGVRAGKSRAALALAESYHGDGQRLFVATAEAGDDEMRRRIDAHRRERGDRWQTLEEPLEIAHAIDARLSERGGAPTVVVVDCLTLWVSNVLLSLDQAEAVDGAEAILAARTETLLSVIAHHATARQSDGASIERDWIVVSNEVGLGVVPSTALGRHFRDALGRVNQLIAERACRVCLMVSGLSVELKAPTRRESRRFTTTDHEAGPAPARPPRDRA